MDAELERWKSAGQNFDYLGFDIFYRREGSGPNLLLIHGYPFNSWDWALIWPTLTQRFTVIAPDMIGMGFSAKPVAYEYTVADHGGGNRLMPEFDKTSDELQAKVEQIVSLADTVAQETTGALDRAIGSIQAQGDRLVWVSALLGITATLGGAAPGALLYLGWVRPICGMTSAMGRLS